MNAALWISILVILPPLAYSLQFTEATRLFGRALSDSDSATGFQAAISPPWETAVGLPIYGLTLTVIGASWYEFGFGRAMLTMITLFVGLSIGRRLLPKPESLHFKVLIIQSMANRYANYVRKGDLIRGNAMKMLLQRAGVDPALLAGQATDHESSSASRQTSDQADSRRL
jgi:hypothetical protein